MFFENLKQLKVGLAGLEGIANKYITGDIKSIERLTPADDLRQPNVNNETELYESGTKALKVFDELLKMNNKMIQIYGECVLMIF